MELTMPRRARLNIAIGQQHRGEGIEHVHGAHDRGVDAAADITGDEPSDVPITKERITGSMPMISDSRPP